MVSRTAVTERHQWQRHPEPALYHTEASPIPPYHTEAVEKIASVRSVVCPAEFFMHQLELYERCNCECDPRKYPEYRRFLMNYNAEEMMGEWSRPILLPTF